MTVRGAAQLVGAVLSVSVPASAATHYVDVNSATPVAPYTNWMTATTNIQDAVDVSVDADTVLVTNGVYATGGCVVYGAMTNRAAITRAITVKSVNGPAVTFIQGQGPAGNSAVRCVYVGTNAVLAGFTLTNGHTRTTGDYAQEQCGGGAWCELSGVVSNCILTGNAASDGGGAYEGTLINCALTANFASGYGGGACWATMNNCTLTDNAAQTGGAAYGGTLNNCTLTGNRADGYSGGAYNSILNNCIAYYNSARFNPNYSSGALRYCCTTPNAGAPGNITNEPRLVSASHIAPDSPCVGNGYPSYASGVDIDGQPWRTLPAIGADEPYADSSTGVLSVAIGAALTNAAIRYELPFRAVVQGLATRSAWDFGDGTALTNRAYASHTWSSTGIYAVVLTAWNGDHPGGVACTTMVSVVEQPVAYADISNLTPAYPYTNWTTAATNIQQAIDADATPGRLVLVADGVYGVGGRVVFGAMTNRVALINGVTVRSVNGPATTVICGAGPLGDGAVRCAYVGENGVLSGFTLTNGYTRTTGDVYKEQAGGGVWCEASAVASNCALRGNSATYGGGSYEGTLNACALTGNAVDRYGGAAYGGTLNNCTLNGNSALYGGGALGGTLNTCTLSGNSAIYGGASYQSTLNNCTLTNNSAQAGGGVYDGTLNNCTLTGNAATGLHGGGAFLATLNNCALTENTAAISGGGASYGTLNNCTLTANSANAYGGGAFQATLNNCIIYYNSAQIDSNCSASTLSYCSTMPNPGGPGNTANEPCLVSAFHIAPDSPCVGNGDASYVLGMDIDDQPWRTPPTIGADEPYADSSTGALLVAIGATFTNATAGCELLFRALIQGRATRNAWDFGDGAALTNRAFASHTWSATGIYAVVLTTWNGDHPDGVVCTTLVSVVEQPVAYADISNLTPAYPYTNWTTAATNIQQAIDADATPGRLVLVADGVYGVGGRVVFGAMTNRVALINGVTVRSVNGPATTVIRGAGPLGDAAVRCAYVGANSMLAGFTLTNGHTRVTGHQIEEWSAGGAWCGVSAILTNCILTGNSAGHAGGGVYGGTLYNCTFTSNAAEYGGGVCVATLHNCTLTGNSARQWGGGACHGTLHNCALTGDAAQQGGGAYGATLNNCTLANNVATDAGGGAYSCMLNNCITYFNVATVSTNWSPNSELNYCCTFPASGKGCVTNAPVFVAPELGDYRLAPSSPGVDAGINQDWMFTAIDLDGNPRVINGTVDMGAYETPFTLNVRAVLQGPYDTNTHAMVAGISGMIPLTSPYSTDPRTVATIPSNAVDWVLVQLLSTNGATVVSKSAFLDAGGYLLATGGGSGITAEISAGYYSVVLKHRNHLAAMSAAPVAFTNILTAYDFTTGADKYTGGTNAAVELEPGVWGLIAGDADGDGMILGADAGIYSNQVSQTGYHRADFNLDGTVDGEDLALGSVNGGRQSGATAPGTPLGGGLAITPQRKTALAGASFTLTALGTSNAVNWAFAANASGATLSPSNTTMAVYTAGFVSNSVDIVQAWEGDRLGRAWVNVIGSNEVAGAGKAIVIAGGKGLNDPLAAVTDYLGDLAYNALLYRGYAKESIKYLNPVPDQDVDGNGAPDDVAAATTLASAASTFTNWAMAGTDRLFVYLVDHGGTSSGEGYFRLNGGETLTAPQLDAWLDGIQEGNEREVVVVLDFCESGSFLDPLKHSRRTVITACSAGEPTYFVAGGLVSFSDAFFGAIVSGQDLAGAFNLAREAMDAYQGALVDANGDGLYQTADLEEMANVYLGPSFIAGKDIPQIGHVMGGQMLQGVTAATLWAYDIASAYPIDRVWCLVVPPGHDPDPDDPVADLPTLGLAYNAATGRYEAQYSGFTELGTYKLVYYARDIWGSLSLPRPSFVEQAGYEERLVLVAGGSTNDSQWSATASLAAYAYRTALARRLGKPALRYLSAGPAQDLDGDGTNDVAAAATSSNLAESITLWPTNANRLTVYLLGSSTTNGLCRLNDTEALSASQLDGWLDSFQASNTAALVVMDFDRCGDYVPSLAPPPERERIVIASAKAGNVRICARDGLLSFSRFFLGGIFNGKSVGAAFNAARNAIRSASGLLRQTPQLDDSGNGIPDQKNIDGLTAVQRYLGAAFATGADAPFIGAVIPDQTVVAGAPVLLWASNVLSDAGISNVWCAVAPPDYDGSGDPPEINLTWSPGTMRYEALSTNFTLPGTCACTFFATDTNGMLSAPVQSLLATGDAYEPDDAPAQARIFPTEDIQIHTFHVPGDEDWVLFYAPTGYVFDVKVTQLGTNSDLALDLYYEMADGGLTNIDSTDYYGTGSNVTEKITLNLKDEPISEEPGIYFVRVSSADTNLFGPDSDYELRIYEPTGGAGGVTLLCYQGPFFQYGNFSVSLGPSEALPAGAAWQIAELGGNWYTNADLYALPVPDSGGWHIAFREVPGFWPPAGQSLSLQANGTITVPVGYVHSNLLSGAAGASQVGNGVFQFSSLQYPGQRYVFEESTNLLQWVPIATNQVPGDGALRLSITNWTPVPRAFYRWRLIQ